MSKDRYDDMFELGNNIANQLALLIPDMIRVAGITAEDDYLAVLDGIHDNFGEYL